jgi:hypothetical protein
LILVSADYPTKAECAENLFTLEENHAISHMAVENLKALFAASESACGEKILFTSTYRTLAFQSSIYGVNPYAAKPGESEHHSGLVADIMKFADYYVFDIGELDADGIEGALSPIIYLLERYENAVVLGRGEGDSAVLVARIEALRNKGVESYIVK